MAATKVFFYGAPPSYWPKFVGPLLRLLTVSKEVERIVLADLLIVTKDVPHLFAPYYARFLVRTDDLTQVKKDKIRLLLHVLTVDNWNAILREFIVSTTVLFYFPSEEHISCIHVLCACMSLIYADCNLFQEYADDTDDTVVSESIRALGVCSARVPESIQMCLTALINMIKSRYGTSQSLVVISTEN